jgi:hypothetical protein
MSPPTALWPPFFSRELWFAWLLREDVRGPINPCGSDPATLAAQAAFFLWWLTDGRRSYPGMPALTAEQIAFANALVALDGPGGGASLPRLLAFLWRQRYRLPFHSIARTARIACASGS